VQSRNLCVLGLDGLCCDCQLWPSAPHFKFAVTCRAAFCTLLSCRSIIRCWRCIRELGCTVWARRIYRRPVVAVVGIPRWVRGIGSRQRLRRRQVFLLGTCVQLCRAEDTPQALCCELGRSIYDERAHTGAQAAARCSQVAMLLLSKAAVACLDLGEPWRWRPLLSRSSSCGGCVASCFSRERDRQAS